MNSNRKVCSIAHRAIIKSIAPLHSRILLFCAQSIGVKELQPYIQYDYLKPPEGSGSATGGRRTSHRKGRISHRKEADQPPEGGGPATGRGGSATGGRRTSHRKGRISHRKGADQPPERGGSATGSRRIINRKEADHHRW